MGILCTNRLDDVRKFVEENHYSMFVMDMNNISNLLVGSGIACSMNFFDIKTLDHPSAIVFSNNNGSLTFTGIEDVSCENHVLGMLMKIATKTGICAVVICR